MQLSPESLDTAAPPNIRCSWPGSRRIQLWIYGYLLLGRVPVTVAPCNGRVVLCGILLLVVELSNLTRFLPLRDYTESGDKEPGTRLVLRPIPFPFASLTQWAAMLEARLCEIAANSSLGLHRNFPNKQTDTLQGVLSVH